MIEEVGDRAARWGVQPGDRVALEVILPCRSCDDCLTGRYMACRHRIGARRDAERGRGLWGGFAEHST